MTESYKNQIIEGDCLEILKRLPSESVDIAFADPPFNLQKKYGIYRDSLEFEEYIKWCKMWITEMVRITKPSGAIFLHNIPKWLTHYAAILNELADFKHWISWNAPTAPMGKTLQPAHYGILFYAKDARQLTFYEIRHPHKRERKSTYLLKDYGGKKKLLHPFGSLVSDVWTDIHRIKHNKYRDKHPCQLPIHLMERILLMASDEGAIVLDPFSGTGTTAIAAKRLGRNYIGIDLDPTYVNIAKNRLTQESPSSKLGDCWVSFYLDQVVSLRNNDWDCVKKYFAFPSDPRDTDFTPAVLNTQLAVSLPSSYARNQEETAFRQPPLFD